MRTHEGHAYYTVGEVADTIGVSSQTLRVWERKGLLVPARSEGGQRLYSEDDVRRAEQVATLRRRHGWNAAAIRSVAGIVHSEAWQHLSLGMRIRTARRERGFTLGKAAGLVGISPSFLSTLERGESGVSVQILARIADALKMPMSAFAPVRPVDATVLRKDERPCTVLAGGVTWEELVSPGHTFEPAVLIVPPGQDSGGPITRAGEIFVFVLAGSLTFLLHDQGSEVVVDREDAIVLGAASPWSWENRQSREARALWVEQLPPGAWDGGPRGAPEAGASL